LDFSGAMEVMRNIRKKTQSRVFGGPARSQTRRKSGERLLEVLDRRRLGDVNIEACGYGSYDVDLSAIPLTSRSHAVAVSIHWNGAAQSAHIHPFRAC
jgi:hypothetical protein